jgi:hypothetical protein
MFERKPCVAWAAIGAATIGSGPDAVRPIGRVLNVSSENQLDQNPAVLTSQPCASDGLATVYGLSNRNRVCMFVTESWAVGVHDLI